MPRRRKKNKGKVTYNQPADPNRRKRPQLEDAGTTIPLSQAPEDVKQSFAVTTDDDEQSPVDTEEDAFAGSEFVDGVGESLDHEEKKVRLAAATTPIHQAKDISELPRPVKKPTDASTPALPNEGERKETFDVSWNQPVEAPVVRSEIEEMAIAEFTPPAKYMGPEETRRHLSWIVSEASVRATRNTTGQLTAVLQVKAMLIAVLYRQFSPDPAKEPPEPFLFSERLMDEPVGINIPLWMFPPEKQKRPDMISLAEASAMLVTLFASMPMEIIKPAPPPRGLLATPAWLRRKIQESKGPVRT